MKKQSEQSEADWLAEALLDDMLQGREYFYTAEREVCENKAE